ncbi:MAG TPA: DUF4407 domain-containing protein [Thermoanaerobaculia bacterium]
MAWCGGAHAALVAGYPEERTRLATVGATVLFTGLFAGAASGYAFYTVFGPGPWVPLLGLAWAAMIFNLDRLIVMSMHGSLRKRWLAAIPRLMLATVIALVIARPLELWIFKDEIMLGLKQADTRAEEAATDEWKKRLASAAARYEAAVVSAGTAAGVPAAQSELDRAAESRKRCQDNLRKAAEDHSAEVDGTGGTGNAGIGPAARTKYAHYLDVKTQCETVALVVTSARSALDTALKRQAVLSEDDERTRDVEIAKAESIRKRTLADRATSRKDSLLGRHRQLSHLASEDGAVLGMTLFITVLFWLVESLPVVAKLMSSDNIYDEMLKRRRAEVCATTRGVEAAVEYYETAAKRAVELRTELETAEAEEAARNAREAMEFRYHVMSSVTKTAREDWQPSGEALKTTIATMENAARDGVAPPVTPPPLRAENFAVDATEPKTATRLFVNGALGLAGTASVVVVCYYALNAFSPLDKVNLAIAVSVATMFAGALTTHNPVLQLRKRFRNVGPEGQS